MIGARVERTSLLILTDTYYPGWTAVTEDGKYSAHFEHTVAVTADGPWILTAREVPVAAARR